MDQQGANMYQWPQAQADGNNMEQWMQYYQQYCQYYYYGQGQQQQQQQHQHPGQMGYGMMPQMHQYWNQQHATMHQGRGVGSHAHGKPHEGKHQNKSYHQPQQRSHKRKATHMTSSSSNKNELPPSKKKEKGDFVDKSWLAKNVPAKYLTAHETGTSEEEVAKWREARRRNYPTQANIQRKLESDKARQENAKEKDAQDDNEDTKQNQEDGLTTQEQGTKKKTTKKQLCFRFAKGTCRRGKHCTYAHDKELKAEYLIKQRKDREKKQFLNATARPNGNDSLLRKLLLTDIEKERKVVLKCIRFMLQEKAKSV